MKCHKLRNSEEFKNSILGKHLIEIYNASPEKAEKEYNKIVSDDFIKLFGDWVSNIDTVDNNVERYRGRVDSEGRPAIFKYEYSIGKYYIKLKDGSHYRLDYDGITNYFTDKEINNILYAIIYNIYLNHTKEEDFNTFLSSKFLINKEIDDFFTFTENKLNNELLNKARKEEEIQINLEDLDLLKSFKSELHDLTINKFQEFGLKFKPSDDELQYEREEIEEKELESTDRGWDIQSIEIDPKIKLSKNVKLMLHFVKKDETESVLNAPVFYEFEHVYKIIQNIIQDVVPVLKENGEVEDVYKLAENKIENIADSKYSLPMLNNLLELMDQFDENKKTEFTKIILNKINYLTTEISKKNNTDRDINIMNVSDVNSKPKQILEQWGISFKNYIFVNKKIDYKKLKVLKDRIDNFIKNEFNPINNKLNKNQNITEAEISNVINKTILSLNKIGINVTEKGFYYYISAQDIFGDTKKLMNGTKEVLQGLSRVLNILSNKKLKLYVNNKFNNPLKYQFVFNKLSQADNFFTKSDLQDTTLRRGNKQYWTYSNFSYLSLKQNIWSNSKLELQQLYNEPGNESSVYIKYLLALDIEENQRDNESQKRTSKYLKNYIFNNIQDKDNFKKTADNKEIKFKDSVIDVINKTLQNRIGKQSYIKTLTPSDKTQSKELSLPLFLNTDFEIDNTGNVIINEQILNIFIDYFQSDLRMAATAYKKIRQIETENNHSKQKKLAKKLVQNHHIKYINGKWRIRNKEGKLVGNVFKTEIFGTFNIPGLLLFNEQNEPLFKIDDLLTKSQKDILKKHFKKLLSSLINKEFNYLVQNKVFSETKKEGEYNSFIDNKIINSYNTNNKYLSLVADYTINSLISNIEYGKMYLGHPSYFKNVDDYIKRVSSTYTDGIPLRIGLEKGDRWFNISVIDTIKKPSKYNKELKQDLNRDDFSNNDETDAQAYITPDRWKFIIKRSKGWTSMHDTVYNKLKGKIQSKLTDNERKIAAQALKGVYFNKSSKGIPTYLKYSQFVLSEQLVTNNKMKNILLKMNEFKIDELIYSSGVKAGAFLPTKIADEQGNILNSENLTFNIYRLDNRFYKIQQDLKPKGVGQTLISSQIKKNIFNNMFFNMDREYSVDGFEKEFTSKELILEIHKTLGILSDIGLNEFQEMLEFDENFKLSNNEKYLNHLISQLKLTTKDSNILQALEKGMLSAALPQIRKKLENIDFALLKKKTVKIKTNGGSFIQTSSFGFDQFEQSYFSVNDINGKIVKEPMGDGIKWFIKPDTLKPPMFLRDKKGNYILNKKGKKIVISGQIFLSHSQFYKLFNNELKNVKNIHNLTGKELLKIIDPRLLKGIGYRIPNQGMSSNSPVEIVGLIPDGHGDAVMAYSEITKQTGSDFDIDKMYLMLPNGKFEENEYKYVEYDKNKELEYQTKASLENYLLTLYRSVLLHPDNLENIMLPVDDKYINENLKNIIGFEEKLPFESFTGLNQLISKFNYHGGKAGVGQMSNHMVSNAISQFAELLLNNVYLGWGNFKNDTDEVLLDKEYSESLTKKEINKYKELFKDNVTIKDISKFKIAKTISLYVNEFVDIGNDNTISKANWNTMTTNVGALLIRAGVHPYKINALLKQPIIEEYVKDRQNNEGITSTESSKYSVKKIYEKYINQYVDNNFKPSIFEDKKTFKQYVNENLILNDISLKQFTLIDLINNIKNNSENNNYILSQLKLLKRFENLLEIAKPLGTLIQAMKSDTNGAMFSFTSMIIHMNKMSQLLTNEHKIGGISGIKKLFEIDGTLTFSAKNYLNSVNIIKELMKNNPDIYLFGKDFHKYIFDNISYNIRNSLLLDENLGNDIEKGMFNYIISQFPEFVKYKNKDIFNNLYSKLSEQLKEFKKKYPNKNFLIDNLENKIEGLQEYIGLNDAKKSNSFNNNFTNAWKDLLYESNDELRKFAEELVIFSYYQSGFNYNSEQIFTYIPHEWMLNTSYDLFISENNNIENIEDFKNKLFKHNYDNTNLVTPIKKFKKFEGYKKANEIQGVYSEVKGNLLIVTDPNLGYTEGYGENKITRYKPYLYKPEEVLVGPMGNIIKTKDKLYKLVAYSANNGEGIYVVTNKLGSKIVNEYSLNSLESIVPENNVDTKISEILRVSYLERIKSGKWIAKEEYEKIFKKPEFNTLENYLKLENNKQLKKQYNDIKTDSNKTLSELGITEEMWNNLSKEEQNKIKRCN